MSFPPRSSLVSTRRIIPNRSWNPCDSGISACHVPPELTPKSSEYGAVREGGGEGACWLVWAGLVRHNGVRVETPEARLD